jgi:hypothetical protein
MSVARNIILPLTMRRLNWIERLPLVGRYRQPPAWRALSVTVRTFSAICRQLTIAGGPPNEINARAGRSERDDTTPRSASTSPL